MGAWGEERWDLYTDSGRRKKTNSVETHVEVKIRGLYGGEREIEP